MTQELLALYPTMDPNDALALTWGGLEDAAGSLWTDKNAHERLDIILTLENYLEGKAGTKCN